MQSEKTGRFRRESRCSHCTRSARSAPREWLCAYWSVTMVYHTANCCSNATFETDIKPDNVLINYSNDATRFSRVALGDCGDVYRFNPNAGPLEESHVISAAIFRSPEAQLNLRWGPPTDIWSLGATVRN